MLKELLPGVYQSELLLKQDRVIHGFSTRVLGDMRKVPPRHVLKAALGLSTYRLVGASQEHKAYVRTVMPQDYGKVVPDVDGLVYRQTQREPRVAVGIISADCVGLLLADQERGVIGAGHAGWQGTRDHIAAVLVESMVKQGARRDHIRVAFGPYIGPCCYNVSDDRVIEFQKNFTSKDVVVHRDGKYFLDLGAANIESLLEAGILPRHIDHHLMCTFDHPDEVYSYRKFGGTKKYGEHMAIIALKA